MESFFHTLKIEWIRGRSFATFAELACPLACCQGRLAGQARDSANRAYIRFYNHHCLHSSIDYQTPEEYERLVA